MNVANKLTFIECSCNNRSQRKRRGRTSPSYSEISGHVVRLIFILKLLKDQTRSRKNKGLNGSEQQEWRWIEWSSPCRPCRGFSMGINTAVISRGINVPMAAGCCLHRKSTASECTSVCENTALIHRGTGRGISTDFRCKWRT